MKKEELQKWWNDIPAEKAHAATYTMLMLKWNCTAREVRRRLHELSVFESGDDFILIRSSNFKGFYKTKNVEEIEAYKAECLSRSGKILAPLKKINRVLKKCQ